LDTAQYKDWGEATSRGATSPRRRRLTWPVLAAGLGLALAVARAWRGSRVLLVVALAALAPYALVASSGHRAMRFLAPVLPAAAWLAALALASLPRRRARRLLTTALLARSAVAAVLVLRLFFVDSRLRAERWMEAHVPFTGDHEPRGRVPPTASAHRMRADAPAER
jgi:hypothetical protein